MRPRNDRDLQEVQYKPRRADRGVHPYGSVQGMRRGGALPLPVGGEIGEAPPVADEASRFRGSAPIGGRDSGRESVGTTVGKRTPPLRIHWEFIRRADVGIGPYGGLQEVRWGGSSGRPTPTHRLSIELRRGRRPRRPVCTSPHICVGRRALTPPFSRKKTRGKPRFPPARTQNYLSAATDLTTLTSRPL